ncbi:DoxX family protein [Aliifodinibius sp. S!AR15-10]|uniref:DoxX family protein n=1 Tax=Aliifodinibius sp. S!AR15-10 TaxID=2950437 RepID=UPI00285F0F24|nr:DoxX family protein [Aliifodinibius sp. S!AR15-10]MDR8393276.1 DoxX family protein [Aliifodinibius sp. S!AR15-10]
MKELLLKTKDNWSPTIIRLMLALVIFPHGAQKLLGWFGGYGFSGTMGYFMQTVGLPWIIGFLVIVIEFFAPLLLAAGLLIRASAAALFGLFVGIIFNAHIQHGFFMNWSGNQAGEGFEYHLLVLGMAAALVISGAGKYSADRYLLNRNKTLSS